MALLKELNVWKRDENRPKPVKMVDLHDRWQNITALLA